MFASLFVVVLGLCYCCKESSQTFLGTPQLFGPSEVLVKDIVTFTCNISTHPINESILLQLFKKGLDAKLLGEFTSLGGENGSFVFISKLSKEGELECVARPQNSSNIEPTVSNTHYLKVVEPVQGATIDILSDPETFEGQRLVLRCRLTAGNHVSYEWLLNDQLISPSPGVLLSDNRLLISRTTPEQSGSYKCKASNKFNNEVFIINSTEVKITVKDVVSAPDISFTILKEESHTYSAMVTCQSTKGTPPVIFSLHNKKERVAYMSSKDRSATFKVPVVLGQDLGSLRCSADNKNQKVYSEWLPMEVVLVEGPVKIHYDYDMGENFAVVGLRFYCKVEKGSHPQYQWFLNETLLDNQGGYFYVVNQYPEQSILLLAVGRSSAGTYHCEVSNTFDNTTVISSRKQYLDKEVLNRLPVLVVAVVFGCFTVLILLVSICCGIGVVFRQRQYGEKSLLGLEMKTLAAYEGELDLTEYDEDDDLVMTSRWDEFDQVELD